jgi:SAM-dependent methyltransferase
MSKLKSIYRADIKTRLKKFLINLRILRADKWSRDDALIKREYKNYSEYVKHQASKLELLDLTAYDEKYFDALVHRYLKKKSYLQGKSLLCLGARTGSECKAFVELGAFAVGIDLNPGESNKYVLSGDFHNIQFADYSVDVVFSNTLDHCFDLNSLMNEINRILKPDGFFYVELVKGNKDFGGRNPGEFESMWWDSINEVTSKIKSYGLATAETEDFNYPWNGTRFIFKKVTS